MKDSDQAVAHVYLLTLIVGGNGFQGCSVVARKKLFDRKRCEH